MEKKNIIEKTKVVASKPAKNEDKQKEKAPDNEKSVENDGAIKSKKKYIYEVGRRKEASAQIRLFKKGDGKITVNGKDIKDYFPSQVMQEIVRAPLKIVGQDGKLEILAKVSGGGVCGQAEAIRHGISKTLLEINTNFRKPLRKHGYLTRDSRVKERKKPGLKRARKAPQWVKR
ncbi:30S ribosomal protein S9 [Candidatus Parcubacteria bacterium]|nr:30S ribosomal protein S9 [Candidatus Parcubacteria bacterium]